MEIKKHYNPICYSLHTDDVQSDKCLKRRFVIYNIIESKHEYVYVCAEYFRLLYEKHRNKSYFERENIEAAIDEAIKQYIPFYDEFNKTYSSLYFNKNNSFENLTVSVMLIERPKIWVKIDIIKAFDIILENPDKCKELKKIVCETLYAWHLRDNFKKDYKFVKLLKETFSINGNYKRNALSIFPHKINENAFIDLIVTLTNKL